MCGIADFSPRGVRGRRLSGRGRSGRLQHHSDQYSGAPLYTVVTMDPNDEVSLLLVNLTFAPLLLTVYATVGNCSASHDVVCSGGCPEWLTA